MKNCLMMRELSVVTIKGIKVEHAAVAQSFKVSRDFVKSLDVVAKFLNRLAKATKKK